MMRNSLDFKNIFKRETKLASYIVICLTIVVISLSYAMFFQVDQNSKNQEVVAGDFTFTYTDGSTITSSGNSSCFEPMSLDESSLYLENCGYRFSVNNAGSLKASYTLKLLRNDESTLEEDKIKIVLRKKVGDVYEVVDNIPNRISELTDGVLLSESIDEKTTIEYNIQLYVEENIHIDEDTSKVVSYQLEGTGIVHEEQPIHTEDTKNMMVKMDVEEECFLYYEDGSCDSYAGTNLTYTQGGKYQSKITRLVFEDTINPYENASEVVDFSEAHDSSVLGYYVPDGTGDYTLYIQANGKIKANPDASWYFFVDKFVNCDSDYTCDSLGIGIIVEGVENVDTTFVTNMEGMFFLVRNETLDLNGFNTSKVINMKFMFYGNQNLNNLDLSLFNTTNVNDMSYMFSGCSILTSLDISSFNTENVTNMSHMFSYCSSITSLELSALKTENVINMSSMFFGMSNLTNLDISNFDTSKVTDMSAMFWDCGNLSFSISYGEHFIHKNDAIITDMFTDSSANKPTHESWNGVTF